MSAQGIALVVLHIFASVVVHWGGSDGSMDGLRVVKLVKDGF